MTKFDVVVRVTAALLAGSALAACSQEEGAEQETAAPAAGEAAPAATTAAATATPGAAPAPPPDNVETLDGTQLANFTGDAAAGETVFAQCRACHVVEPGVNRIGPSLHNIVGRPAGSVEGYNYSPANANSGITWTQDKLFQYLENPHRVIPGTKMAFAGLPDPQNRANVIAFLETQSGEGGAAAPAQ